MQNRTVNYIADTNIISRYFSGRDEETKILVSKLGLNKMGISVVSKFELRFWISNFLICDKAERVKIIKLINSLPVVHLSTLSSKLAEEMTDTNINAKLADSLIAATCMEFNLPLLTLNKKDFQKISGLSLI